MNQQSEAEKKVEKSSSSRDVKPPEEARALDGAVAGDRIEKGSNPPELRLIDKLLNIDNLNEAFIKVVDNKGAAGVDGMEVGDLKLFLRKNWPTIEQQLKQGKYKPQPVKKVEIPKPDGGVRMLGIPTVLDRFLQQALLQVLTPIWEPTFSDNSFGFRPGRKAIDAVKRAKGYQEEGYRIVIDMDLSKFFDEIPHDRLMSKIMLKTPGEREIHKLIHGYLTAGMMKDGLIEDRSKGSPQGSPCSPLLSNIVLDELDKELEKRGHRFCRYADDVNVYVKTKRAGDRAAASIQNFVEKKMKLKVNKEKSKVDRPVKRKFLGFSFYYKKGKQMGIRVAPKSVTRLKETLRDLFHQGRGRSLPGFIHNDLNPVIRGWFNYYRPADMKSLSQDLDEWIRHRLRNILWRQWKRNWTRFLNLRKGGLSEEHAVRSAFNQRGPWFNSGASHMNLAFPKKYFDELRLFSFVDAYKVYTASQESSSPT
ncbi:group II intron reverse transcriptase/maturase [Arachidicoccus soli]|uniref:RNA-directed DNA polymerase n=1 Tax=Arachidicoccus soli TaxID=2341117 RepID=A0A386HKS9_9BACT|nr:group II intron reverse transcriptase/maturase [Arachidicoccus soli]AYD46365.1 group II intron reverse transcriptase/maturase [Arachidicoccus soli]AYD48584.1 group II intron reverse transcriptase/maturase [Arachidicoccus soli]AYD48594.1 group II intron reverse transcriptase/maturase [Arachidicoccus soli]AYD48743.1 group II intron reverse transcriptase/maturase [Arachidicoccus soli]AYD48745.1 group II intron reverse transcriptase/maturase [Arachidicoccus soli]